MNRLSALLGLVLLVGCPSDPTLEDVHEEVFLASCAFSSCHGAQGAGGLSLLTLEDARSNLLDVPSDEVPGAVRVVPGDPEGSLLYRLLLAGEGDAGRMPPSDDDSVSIDEQRIAMVRAWIESEAE